MTITGATEKDDRWLCDKCGSDIDEVGTKYVAHFDGSNVFGNVYNCLNCKNVIRVTHQRKGSDLALWSDD